MAEAEISTGQIRIKNRCITKILLETILTLLKRLGHSLQRHLIEVRLCSRLTMLQRTTC
jgi:N-acetylmuramic acid 6-phosphate (MurNAc-6-P) etherase